MYVEPSYDFEWVRTLDELTRAAAELQDEPVLAVDTETSGWQTGNEQLCLIQIGIPSKRRVVLVDVLATGAPIPLAPVMNAATPLIVAHNASFEERQFARFDIKMKGVRDTLSMSRDLRPDLPNHTLRTCCKLLLGMELSKEQQVSDWSLRPLSDEQIKYARLDAEVSVYLYDYLAQLEERVKSELTADLPILMQEYASVCGQRYQLTASIAHELAFFTAREQKLREAIRQKLIDGSPSYDGPYGTCAVSKVKRTEVNVQKVRELYPEFADEVIAEYVERKRFDMLARERGLPKNAIESVLETVGYTERLQLILKDESGSSE
jgi:hypothetical protein